MLSAGLRWFRTSRLRRPIKKWANVLSGAEVATLSMVGVPQHIAELVIGHALPGIFGVYNRYGYLAEKRDALNRWAAHMLDVVGEVPRVGAEIVALRA